MNDDTELRRQAAEIPHDYISTSCLHELHQRCRLVCKWCTALCRCSCHGPKF